MPRRSTPFALTDALRHWAKATPPLKVEKQVSPLFFIPVFIVNAYKTAAEGEYLTEGDEHGVVDLTHWRCHKPRH